MSLMPLSVADPYAYVLPYLMLVAVCLIVFVGCLIGVPSLRSYRRRRNLIVYSVFILVLGLIVCQTYNASLGPNYVSFSIQKTQTPIYSIQANHFTVTVNSDGAKDANFYMVLVSANATMQTHGQEGYIQVNDTCIKIPFNFHGNGQATNPVYFTADADVSSIAFYPHFEKVSGDYVIYVELSEIQCLWDPPTRSFAMGDSMPLPVP
jgi:hypothetical protein